MKINLKEMIDSEEKVLDSLKDGFKIRNHYFPINVQKYSAFMYKDGKAIPVDPNTNK